MSVRFCVVCCQVEVSATSWSLVQRSPTGCAGSNECDLQTSWMRRPWPPLGCSATGGGGNIKIWLTNHVGYRNCWTKLTNQQWKETPICYLKTQHRVFIKPQYDLYKGWFIFTSAGHKLMKLKRVRKCVKRSSLLVQGRICRRCCKNISQASAWAW
jgi:hypothetical protein